MRKRKIILSELIKDNKKEIERDHEALERIEKKIENKYSKRVRLT